MESKAKIFGHAIHPMLIVFPLGLLAMAVIFDVISMVTKVGNWHAVAFPVIGASVIGGLVAAVFGLVDWVAIPSGTRAKAIGTWHGVGNVIVVGLFSASWLLRRAAPEHPSTLALVLSFAAVALALVTGWLGGELVERLGVGVDKGANLNAPSSLSGGTGGDQSITNQRLPGQPV